MSIIWKRPDGSQNADPDSFRRIQLSSGDKIWVHKVELFAEKLDWYPFQLGGDWSREEETRRLNRFVNMLDAPDDAWESLLVTMGDDDMDPQGSSGVQSVAETEFKWIESLENDIKGDKWEVAIIITTLKDIKSRLQTFFAE